jgi:xylulokinase
LQKLADILNINIHTINTAEGGALGAVILAMVGCKKYKDVKSACKTIIHDSQTFKPDSTKHKNYLIKFNY